MKKRTINKKNLTKRSFSMVLTLILLLSATTSLEAADKRLSIIGGGLKEKLTFEKYLQWSGEKNHDKLWERAKNLKKGHTPKSLFINNQQQGAGSGWHPNPVEQQNGAKDAYLHLGQLTITSDKTTGDTRRVMATASLINSTSLKKTDRVNLKITKSGSTTFTVGKTLGISETLKLTAGGVEGSATLSVDLKKEKSTTQTHGVEGFIQADVELTPYTKAKVSLYADSSERNINWKAPAHISGWLGIDYGKRVDGHYFWFIKLDSNQKRYVTGTFRNVNVFNFVSKLYGEQSINKAKQKKPGGKIKKVSKGRIG